MKKLILLALFGFLSSHLFSQHEHHIMADTMSKKKDTIQMKPATEKMDNMDMPDHSTHSMSMPSHSFSRNLPMNRNGSGTGWNPDASPMYMWMKSTEKQIDVSRNLFLRYTNQDIFQQVAGDDEFSAPIGLYNDE
jgi:hypothetical protein